MGWLSIHKKVVLITAATALFVGVGGYAYIDHIEGSKQVTAPVAQVSKQNVAPVTKNVSNPVIPNEINEETISANHAIFKNYEDALSLSQVVAEVVATDNSQNIITDENGFTTGHTLTEVQVNKVFENKSGNKAEMTLLSENSQYEMLKNDVIQNLYGESVDTTDQ